MALELRSIKGTQDVLPQDSWKWQFVERQFLDTAALYGFSEIRIPTFEDKNLFIRSVGDTTGVVQKEMYTFTDQEGRELALRPEGTAGVNRAVVESGLIHGALPLKLSYILSCFRAEKPQAGRLREFHQLGMEVLGPASPAADAELIAFVSEFLARLGLQNISLEINSIGCPSCREGYHRALKAYFSAREEELCPTCRERLGRNPMWVLDCKNPTCQDIASEAPQGLDFLCGGCASHFEGLKRRLDVLNIPYAVNPRMVHGLDYYTRTVFEFVSADAGAQGTLCSGGRYDGLVKSLGGPDQPGIGCAMGVERLLMALEAQDAALPQPAVCDLYIASVGEEAGIRAMRLAADLRGEGFFPETDLMDYSLELQMKYAGKLGARFSMALGEKELQQNRAAIKNMATGETREVALDSEAVSRFLYDTELDKITGSLDIGALEGLMGGLTL